MSYTRSSCTVCVYVCVCVKVAFSRFKPLDIPEAQVGSDREVEPFKGRRLSIVICNPVLTSGTDTDSSFL